jgi:outer membrane usher protein
MHALRLIVGAALSLMFVELTASPAHGEEAQPAPLSLFVNEEEKPASVVLLRGEEVLVLRKDLEDGGLRRLPANALETIDGMTYVALGRLSPAVRFKVDERSLSLRIVAPPEYFAATVVSLGQEAPRDMVQYGDAGFFFNYAPRLIDSRALAASGEVGLSVRGRLLFSGVSYEPAYGPVRGLTNLTVDQPGAMRRWVIGDSLVTGAGNPLAGSVVMGGVNLARSFELDPYFVRFPTPVMVGTALTASMLEVYVNGALVRREPVSPGQFQLQGIPASTGAGTTRYVLRDAFGREQEFASSFYASTGVLSRGVSDYGFAAGAIRDRLGTSSWNYHTLAMSGRYRFGITNGLTLGFRAEGPLDPGHAAASGGPSLTLLAPIGQLELGFAASTTRDAGDGIAGYASYLYQSRAFSGGIGVRGMSDRYYTLNLAPQDDHPLVGGSCFVSAPVGHRLTLSLDCTLARTRDSGASSSIGVQSSIALSKIMTFYATASRTRNADGTAPFEAYASVSIQLGGSVIGSTSGHVLGTQADGTLNVSKSAPAGAGYGYQAAVTRGAQTLYSASVQGQVQYGQGQVFLTGVDTQPHAEVGFAGGVVLIPAAGVFFTRPVQDGYAVIRVPGAANVRGYLNNNEIGRTDASGNLLVPNLLSYYANLLSVNDQDLPADFQIDRTGLVAATSYRGAAVVQFDAKRISFVRGTLVVRESGKDTIPSYGELTMHAGHELFRSPVARDGEVEFEGLVADSYAARIEYAEGVCNFTLVVPERNGAVADLGTVACVKP